MLDETVSDNRLHRMLASYLQKFANGRTAKLKGLRLCGSQVLKFPAMAHNVYVTSNGENASFFGTTRCNSAWACPRCSAKVMADKAARIACLIDAEATWHGEYAFMVTFTLPHIEHMYCADTFDVLRATWRLFTKGSNKVTTPYWKFRKKFGIEYHVRVYDVTWGENGWHPHIHALFFTKPENFAELQKYEDELTKFWFQCARYCHFKLLEKKNRDAFKVGMDAEAIQELLRKIDLDELSNQLREEIKNCRSRSKTKARAIHRLEVVEAFRKSGNKPEWMILTGSPVIPPELRPMVQLDGGRFATSDLNDLYRRVITVLDAASWVFVNNLYSNWRLKPVTGHRSVYFSRDKNGKVRKESSSRYISGWGGNSELTRTQLKAPRKEGHYTPFQMLTMAYETNDPQTRDRWLKLFVDYALATFKHRRCEFSPNCGKLITKWQQSEEYLQTYKKKDTDKEIASWKVVYWFSEQQWYDTLAMEKIIPDIRDKILQLACQENARGAIADYLGSCGLKVNLFEHPQEHIINNYLSFTA